MCLYRSRRAAFPLTLVLFCLTLLLAISPAGLAQSVFRFPGTTAVQSSAATQSVTLMIVRGGALDSIRVRTQGNDALDYTFANGGTCASGVTYSAGQQCTVNVAFSPTAPGERRGAVVLLAGQAVLATQWLSAVATGPIGTFIPGTINTVAGDTVWIYAGDGGLATQSSIFLPFGVAVDAAGDLFIADSSNNRIRKVDAVSQIISTIAGNGILGGTGDGGPAIQASLSNPTSIAVDPAGNIFFADNGNNVIRRISAFDGTIATVAGKIGSHGYTGDHGPATSATLTGPNGIALDAQGDLYLADTANNVVRMVNAATGIITTVAGTGAATFTGDNGPAVTATLNAPWGIAVTPSGALIIADQGNTRIRQVDLAGLITTIAGNGVVGYSGDGEPASAATVNVPAGVALDVAGNLYIADSGNNVIRKINALTGIITSIAGNGSESITGDNGPASAAGLYGPYTLALDGQGSLLIADVFHNRIRKVFSNAAVLDYPPIRAGRISAPLSQTLENDGNAPLNVSTITPVTDAQVDPVSTTCSITAMLPPLGTCVVSAQFAPTSVGNPVTGSINVTSDASNSPGVLSLVGQVLNVDPSSVVLTSSTNPSVTGTTVVFSVSVSSVGTTPTGSISLLDGTNVLATGALGPGGAVTFNVSTLAAGQHNMTASYAGDTNNAAGVSAVLIQTVHAPVAPTVTNLSSSANPVVAGASLILTAQVQLAVAGSASGALTGSVTFQSGQGSGSVLYGTANLVSGVASLNVTTLPVGPNAVVATYNGNASYGASSSAPLYENVVIATTRTALSTSANPSSANGSLTLSATVTGNGGIPGGSAALYDGSVSLGVATLNASGTASLTVTGAEWTVGTHTLTAVYAGDASNGPSTSPVVSQRVVLAASSIKLASSLNPAALGATVTLTGAVTSNGGTPSGSLQFFDGALSLGSIALDPVGNAALNVSTLALGSHTITAQYSGDGFDAASQSTALVEVIQPASIAAILSSSANPSTFGTVLSLTATITGNGGVPVGTVSFADGTSTLGNLPLTAAGTATLTTASLSIGSHNITAYYSGDANHAAVGSNTLTQAIVQGTTTTLSSSNLNPIAGTMVTWTATVTGANGQPTTGAISLLDGKTVFATLTPNALGVATLTSVSLPPGSHVVTAFFAGDALDATSTSAPLTSVVTIATTAVTLASSANPSFSGAALTFVATVTGNGGTPGGTVAFMEGATVLGNATVTTGGLATWTTSTLAPGIHKIVAAYAGDTDDAAAVSLTLNQQIAERTTVSLASSANPSLLTDAVTFSVTVSNGVPSLTPTGQVVLTDGGAMIGSAILDGTGSASFTVPALTLGQHMLVATYSGDDEDVPATSVTLVQTVSLRPSHSSLSVSSSAISAGQQLFLVAVVQGSGPMLPTGMVTFSSGTGSGAIVFGSAAIDATGLATVTSIPLEGQYKVIATYSGDGLFAASVSPIVAVTVGPPVEFSMSMQPPAMSLQSGAHGTIQIAIATAATFHDTLAFGCAGLPASATCTFSSDKVAVGGGAAASLYVIVDTGDPLGVGPTASMRPGAGGVLACALPAAAFLMLLLGGRRRRVLRRGLLGLVLLLGLASLTALSGCGNTFNTQDTPSGKYTFQIVGTGQSSGATQAGTVTLTVTQ